MRTVECKTIVLVVWIVAAMFSEPALVGAADSHDPFASAVVEYAPAPGQFVNHTDFNDPQDALGPPTGAGTGAPSNSSVVTLGGFGGFIVLGFDHLVEDDPRNPYGMDAIVYGNAFWVGGNPQRHWAECVTIEISLDSNGNQAADDPWYLIPGSHIIDPMESYLQMAWDDDTADTQFPPSLSSWIPDGMAGEWSSDGFELSAALFGATVVVNPSSSSALEGIFGYGDYSPTLLLGDMDGDNVVDDASMTPTQFYTWPDDPMAVGVTRGAGGGDAFDIAWAIDADTNLPVELQGFHFIRLTTAVSAVSPTFGEKSGEIDAVADVRPDPFGDADEDDDMDLQDAGFLQRCMARAPTDAECVRFDAGAAIVDAEDVALFTRRMTGPR